MKVKVWGVRGSVPAPGPETNRYGGNTSCVQVTLSDGTVLALDAGTGIRSLGLSMPGPSRINILLTHLHLDHIQGLMFFAPAFRPKSEITIWGPEAPEASLESRIARYLSAPLSPVEVRELPCDVSFLDTPEVEWEIGPARIRAASVSHRGPTLGYRITEGDQSLCYIPDHEPALGADLDELAPEWISGFELARGASVLIHDCQYTDDEYPDHVGWGHSSVTAALSFAKRVDAHRTMLFHHDPLHSDDALDRLQATVEDRWTAMGADPAAVELAVERREIEVGARAHRRDLSRLSHSVLARHQGHGHAQPRLTAHGRDPAPGLDRVPRLAQQRPEQRGALVQVLHDEGQAPEPRGGVQVLGRRGAGRVLDDLQQGAHAKERLALGARRRRAFAHAAQVQPRGLDRRHRAVQVRAEGHHVIELRDAVGVGGGSRRSQVGHRPTCRWAGRPARSSSGRSAPSR